MPPSLNVQFLKMAEPLAVAAVIKEGYIYKEGGDSLAKQFRYQTSLIWQKRWMEVREGEIIYKEGPSFQKVKGKYFCLFMFDLYFITTYSILCYLCFKFMVIFLFYVIDFICIYFVFLILLRLLLSLLISFYLVYIWY